MTRATGAGPGGSRSCLPNSVRLSLAAAGLMACFPAADPALPVRVDRSPAGDSTRLTLVPLPGVRINARLKPALELADGTVLRFDSSRLTADSAYFADPPSVFVAGREAAINGRVRASVCGDEATCRPVELDL